MSVFRVEKNRNYTTMSNYHLRDKNLSLKAKGLLSQMLSLPEDWDYTLKGLSVINKEKVDAIRTAVNELEKAGYIIRDRERDEKGQLGKMEYLIREIPLSAHQEKPPEKQPKKTNSEDRQDSSSNCPNKPVSEPDSELKDADTAAPDECDITEESSEASNNPDDFSYSPMLDEPVLDFPMLDNPMQLNTEAQSTDLRNKESYSDSIPHRNSPSEAAHDSAPKKKRYDATAKNDYYAIWQRIKKNISYDELLQDQRISQEDLNDVVDVMLENLCTNRKTIRVAKSDWPAAQVKERLYSLRTEHIRFVLVCISQNTTQVRNIRQYLLTSLYNAVTGIHSHRRFQTRYENNQKAKVPMGGTGELGEAELEAIRRVMSLPVEPYEPLDEVI